MAFTINASAFLNITDETTGIVQLPINIIGADHTPAGDVYVAAIQAIGTTAEAFALGDATTYGWSFFKNLSATEDVQIGLDSSGFLPLAALKPGEWCVIPLAVAPWGKSLGVGAIKVQYAIVER